MDRGRQSHDFQTDETDSSNGKVFRLQQFKDKILTAR